MTIVHSVMERIKPSDYPVIDDGRDYGALIIWNMNAHARARTRSPFVPAPAPVQVMQPKFEHKAISGKKTESKKAKKVKFSARNLVAVMLGKTLSYAAILSALDKHYPDHGLTTRNLQTRILTMINSPHIQITRHETPIAEFTLTHVDGEFYVNSERKLAEA